MHKMIMCVLFSGEVPSRELKTIFSFGWQIFTMRTCDGWSLALHSIHTTQHQQRMRLKRRTEWNGWRKMVIEILIYYLHSSARSHPPQTHRTNAKRMEAAWSIWLLRKRSQIIFTPNHKLSERVASLCIYLCISRIVDNRKNDSKI